VITKILGGDRQITLRWASNREADLADYRVYRANTEDTARDLRLMTLVHTEVVSAGDPSSRPAEVSWNDTDVIGGKLYWYRLVAIDDAGNVSSPTLEAKAQAFDTTPPPALPIDSAEWIQRGSEFIIRVNWVAQSDLHVRLQRRPLGSLRWLIVTDWLDANSGSGEDASPETWLSHELRLQLRSLAGNLSEPGPLTLIQSVFS
jgi:hypothetical protein